MKLLYITNGINEAGGLERVLAVKASYLTDILNYEIHILTLNNSYQNPFYNFSTKINFHDIKVNGNLVKYFLNYKKGIQKVIKTIQPNVISVCDDGLKGILFPIIFGKNIPVIYERHVSKQIEIKNDNSSLFEKVKSRIIFKLMNIGGNRFDKFVVLTNGNLKEWEQLNNLRVIPNPLPFNNNEKSFLTNKKVLVVGRQSYQKGYDSLLKVWKIVNQKQPGWQLEVYGKIDSSMNLNTKANELGISSSIKFIAPIKNIEEKYKEASLYLMTSRFEGFGMVLIEAMSYGVPCISFDCPHGPADIIKEGEDGFLIKNGNIEDFANKIIQLIENENLRKEIGSKAKVNVTRFLPEMVVKQWDELFKSLSR